MCSDGFRAHAGLREYAKDNGSPQTFAPALTGIAAAQGPVGGSGQVRGAAKRCGPSRANATADWIQGAQAGVGTGGARCVVSILGTPSSKVCSFETERMAFNWHGGDGVESISRVAVRRQVPIPATAVFWVYEGPGPSLNGGPGGTLTDACKCRASPATWRLPIAGRW